ncbi:MAG: hypothetical protein ACJ789_08770 [Thermomicrobiales bacterium]|jgi:hypothetical protein
MTEQETTEDIAPPISEATDLAVVRELVLKAHPDVVPELIAGNSVAELTASIEPAKAAFQRIAEAMTSPLGGRTMPPPAVPAGGSAPAIDPDTLPAAEKIRRGIEAGRRKG